RSTLKGLILFFCVIVAFALASCSQSSSGSETAANPTVGNTPDAPAAGGSAPEAKTEREETVKTMPDSLTEVKLGLPSRSNTSYLPIYVALEKGFYKDRNLDVNLTYVQGGVLAMRGLLTDDFHLISTLPESVITAL